MPPSKVWEAIIVGGGPAGLAAGIHLARAGCETLLLERSVLGGQARLLELIENYPGFPDGIRGRDLMSRWVAQARRWGLNLKRAEAKAISWKEGLFTMRTVGLGTATARAVLYCPGSEFKELGVPGESRFRGRGIYHGAFERSPRWRDKAVAVAGGGEAAVAEAIALSRHAGRVYLISRGGRLKTHRLLLRRLIQRPNILWLARTTVEKAEGNGFLQGLRLRRAGGGGGFLEAAALFVLIGKRPPPLPFGPRPPAGFFVAGDAAGGDFRQVAVAGGDGVRAAMACLRHLEGRGA